MLVFAGTNQDIAVTDSLVNTLAGVLLAC